MDRYKIFYVQKSPNAFDDTLVMFGLAIIIDDLTEGLAGITITDQGSYYQLSLSQPLLHETIERRSQMLMPARALATEKTTLPQEISVVHYETVRDASRAYYEARKQGITDVPEPDVHWDIYRALNPAALTGYNSLMVNWFTARQNPEVLFILFDLYAALPNDVDAAMDRWKALNKKQNWKITVESTRQQLYNPDSGKGQNKVKADGLNIGNVDGFWLSEWLKAVGFYEGAITKQLRGSRDRKTLVLSPRQLTFNQHQTILAKFRASMVRAETSIRFDTLAAIRYIRALLEYVEESHDDDLFALIGTGDVKNAVVGGFYTAFYKDMGNVVATMNLSFIALPGWVTIKERDDISIYRQSLEELERIVTQFDESRSDDVTLLGHLRDFISGDDLRAFFRFTDMFPAYLIGKRERNQYAGQLTTELIERLIMKIERPLKEILDSQGFRNVAYAIRQATVTAQWRKKQGDNKYEVRYGLGQSLARKARYPHDFIVALSDFLHKYNAENARVMEIRPKPWRRSVATSDMEQVTELIDKFGSEVVASMLIAYGHARLPREENLELEEEVTTNEEE